MSVLYKKIPDRYDPEKIKLRTNKINRTVIRVSANKDSFTPRVE